MARTGLYKSEVKKARDALIAQSKHPSVDAVRIALGNTGSKTTIHKYLKELEAEDGAAGDRKASISEALQDLVERLAARLQDEANVQVDALRAEQADRERQHAKALNAAQQETDQLRAQLQRIETAMQHERDAHDHARERLQREEIARLTAVQQVADLRDRLVDKEAHCQSLEDKHQRAYEALEHYRQSVKEQREQDQRRHEQQIQQLQAELRQMQQTIAVKQEEVTRLNQDGARLVADLSHAQKALYDEQAQLRHLTQKLEVARADKERCRVLEAQAAERENHLGELRQQLAAATTSAQDLATQLHTAQLESASTKAALATQQTLVTEWRALLDARPVLEQPGGKI